MSNTLTTRITGLKTFDVAPTTPRQELDAYLAGEDTAAAARTLAKLTTRYTRKADQEDREICAANALALALSWHNADPSIDLTELAKIMSARAVRDAIEDGKSRRTLAADPADPDTAARLEDDRLRLTYWTPQAPDAITRTGEADVLADAAASLLATASADAWALATSGTGLAWEDVAGGVLRVEAIIDAFGRIGARGPMPRELDDDALADLTDHAVATITRHAWEAGRARVGATITEADAKRARQATRTVHGLPVARATFSAHTTEATPVATYVVDLPLPLTMAGRLAYLRARPVTPITTQGTTRRTATAEDRAADLLAEAMTPLAGVNKPSNRRKRDGSVGSPTTMPVARGTWQGRQA